MKKVIANWWIAVGGGSGTIGAIEGLRAGGFSGPITVITKEGYLPIDRTKLSKALLTDVSKAQWRDAEFFKEASIDFVEDEVSLPCSFARLRNVVVPARVYSDYHP